MLVRVRDGMKHIVAIVGSPRKGETYRAVQRLEEEMKKLGEVRVEVVMLADIALKDCLGCNNCIMRSERTCHEAGRVKALQDKMLSADAVVLASPAYNQNVTSVMKKFLDYFTFLWHRPAMFGVRFFGVATGGGMFRDVFKTLRQNVESWGGIWAGSLGVPHYESLTPKYRKKQDGDFARQAARLMRAAGRKDLPAPTLGRLMGFRMWRMNAALGFCPPDREYWQRMGWLDGKRKYFYDAPVNPAANALAAAAMAAARRFLRGVYAGY
jgi:multimeric flavodoxin WrbA